MSVLVAVLERLPRACVEGAVFVLLIALVCRLAPRLSARYRAGLWWLASAKLLFALLPLSPLALQVLPPVETVVTKFAAQPPTARTTEVVVASSAPSVHLRPVLGAAWAIGVVLLFAASVPGAWRARAWRRSGLPVTDGSLRISIDSAARSVGLRHAPEVRLVSGLPGPLVVGLIRPAVLLPQDAPRRLTPAELAMALEHEMTHLARRDLWLGLIPAAARRVLFFHPLAWLAEREYAIAREAACDEAVIRRAGADVFVYGKLLLRLAVPRPAATATLSPRSVLRRRLEMIESTVRRSPLHTRAAWALVAVAVIAFVPVKLVARETPPIPPTPPAAAVAPVAPTEPAESVEPAEPETTPEPPTPAPRAMPTPTARPAAPALAPPAPPPVPRSSTTAPVPLASPVAALAPPPPPEPRSSTPIPAVAPPAPPPPAPGAPEAPTPAPRARRGTYIGSGACLELGDPKRSAYVILYDVAGRLCGDPSAMFDAAKMRNGKEDLIWFRVDDQTYVIRDAVFVREALAMFQAQDAMDDRHAMLADQQAVLHERQAELARREVELAEQQGRKELSTDELEKRSVEMARQAEMDNRNQIRMESDRARVEALRTQTEAELAAHAAATNDALSRMISNAMRNGTAQRVH